MYGDRIINFVSGFRGAANRRRNGNADREKSREPCRGPRVVLACRPVGVHLLPRPHAPRAPLRTVKKARQPEHKRSYFPIGTQGTDPPPSPPIAGPLPFNAHPAARRQPGRFQACRRASRQVFGKSSQRPAEGLGLRLTGPVRDFRACCLKRQSFFTSLWMNRWRVTAN